MPSICLPVGGPSSTKLPAASLIVRAAPIATPTPSTGSPVVRTKRPVTAVWPGAPTVSVSVVTCDPMVPSTTPFALTVRCVVPTGTSAARRSRSSPVWPGARNAAGRNSAVTPAGNSDTAAAGSAVKRKSPAVLTVNAPLAVPRGVVTTTGPVVAPIGTVVVMPSVVAVRTSARTPLKATATGPSEKLLPDSVTNVPATPLDGTMAVIAGLSTTRKARRAGERSSLPARSRAFTSKTCWPSARPVSVTLVAGANALQAPPASRQENVRSAGVVIASLPVKMNVALTTALSPSGPLVIVVSGAVLSTITERAIAVDSLPATSVTFTDRVCAPSVAVVVSQAASAVTVGAGAAGLSVTESG